MADPAVASGGSLNAGGVRGGFYAYSCTRVYRVKLAVRLTCVEMFFTSIKLK